jgi:hypothetical protein
MLYISPWSRFELTTSVVIDTDCIGSCCIKFPQSRMKGEWHRLSPRLTCFDYEHGHNSTNINKQLPLMLSELTEHKKNHGIGCWKSRSWLRTLVIDTDCIGSCKSNYHTITATTSPQT